MILVSAVWLIKHHETIHRVVFDCKQGFSLQELVWHETERIKLCTLWLLNPHDQVEAHYCQGGTLRSYLFVPESLQLHIRSSVLVLGVCRAKVASSSRGP